jgi:exopolysaccharide biosynthesis predicted pyruvyltransferase EpsI
MERIDNDVFLSVGMNDTKSYIFKIPIQKIMNLLNKEQFEVKESMALSQKIAIGNVGFFGKGNIGDEMFFEIYQKMFPSLSWSAVGNDLGPLDSHFSLKDVIVIGGGDLICSGKNYRGFLHSDYPQSKPTFLFSIGGGDHLIDIKFEKKDELVDYYRSFFFNKNIKFLSVRGFKTEQTLKKVFPDLQLSGVYPDMVASIDLPYFPLKNRLKPQKLGFIWREEINKFYAEKTSNLLKLLSEYGYQTDILLLGYKNSEAERAEKETIQKFINNQKPIFKNVKNFENSDSAISGIGHYDIILSSRLHGSILATMMGIPCLSFLRGYKFQDFYSFFSQSYIIPHDEWQPDEALLLLNNTKPFTKEEILTVKKKARNGLYHLMSEIYACVSS